MDNMTAYNNKIEGKHYINNDNYNMSKPVYFVDKNLFCGIIEYNNKKYYMDLDDFNLIINFSKKFIFENETDLYPSYSYNEHRINYLHFLYHFREINVNYSFKNLNPFDMRRSNVTCYHIYHKTITELYNVIEYIPGHFSKHGVDPYYMKNPMWKIKENDKEYLLMYCEKNTICKFCKESYQKILDYELNNNEGKKITFHKHSNGYILSSNSLLFIHQIITGCYGNGKGTKKISVDHIDRNPLNNTWENLRIANREEQEQNSKGIASGTKRARKSSAKQLPDGLTQDMMEKYVCYYHEVLNRGGSSNIREYFKVETHPKLDKVWIGTKSNKVSLIEKLKQANKIVQDLEQDIYPIKK